MNTSFAPINFTVTQNVIDKSVCRINESAVYQYMVQYPHFSFWLIFVAFMAILLYLYLPLLIPFFRRIGGVSGFILQGLLTTSFIGVGVGVILMIPVVFHLSEADFKVLGVLQNVIVGVGVVGFLWFVYSRMRKKKVSKRFKRKL